MASASTTLQLAGYRAADAAPSAGAFLSGHPTLGLAMALPSLVHGVWDVWFWGLRERARTRTYVARQAKELRELEAGERGDGRRRARSACPVRRP